MEMRMRIPTEITSDFAKSRGSRITVIHPHDVCMYECLILRMYDVLVLFHCDLVHPIRARRGI
jgi:hypothetical protein